MFVASEVPKPETVSVWEGVLVAVFGALLVIAALTRTDFIAYRLLVSRSRILWKDRVHGFHMVSGVLCILAGLLMIAFG